MRWLASALLIAGLATAAAHADPNDLSDGVFIAHHPPQFDWSCLNQYGTCRGYDGCDLGIHGCDEQNTTIAASAQALWYVLAAWHDSDRVWCGVEFGLGAYDPASVLVLNGSQCPASALAIPYGAWPGPNTGISLGATSEPWAGSFRPVYWFACYAYGPGEIPLTPHPGTGFGGFANCLIGSRLYPAVCFGSMGLFQPGLTCCPPTPEQHACCVDGNCYLMWTRRECEESGGVWHPEWDSCASRPCYVAPEPAVCCVGHLCYFLLEVDCAAVSGQWHPETLDCGPPNPCDAYTPVAPSSWGSIKAIYR